MKKILHKLLYENSSTSLKNIFSTTLHELGQKLPRSRLTVIISPSNVDPKLKQNQRIFFGPLDNDGGEKPIYYASAIKPAIVSVVAAEATRQGILPNDPIIPLTLDSQITWELYSDLVVNDNHPGNNDKGFPYLSRIILPMVKVNQLSPLLRVLRKNEDKKNNKSLKEITGLIRDQKTKIIAEALILEHEEYHAKIAQKTELIEQAREKKKQYYEGIKDKTDDLGKTSLGELIRSALGPSSNAAISILVKYLGNLIKENGITPQDFIQNRMDEILGSESLLTINNSSKEKKTGLWNAGRLSELLTIFTMIMDNDPRLGLADEYIVLMKNAMEKEFADPVIELKLRINKMGFLQKTKFIGKSGYFSNLDILPGKSNSMDTLMKSNDWGPSQTAKTTYIIDMERLITEGGKTLDIAVSIGIPHNETDNDLLQKQKIMACGIVMEKISILLESLLK